MLIIIYLRNSRDRGGVLTPPYYYGRKSTQFPPLFSSYLLSFPIRFRYSVGFQ